MKQKLDPRAVARLKPHATDYDVWDSLEPGLGVHVFPSGAMSWTFRYRNPSGRQRRLRIGSVGGDGAVSLADAREAARTARREVELGRDPQEAKVERREADTVGQFAETYIERHAKVHKKSWQHDQRMLDADVLPTWRHRAMREITKRDVRALIDAIVDRGALSQALHVYRLLGKFFQFATQLDVVEHNIVRDVPKPSKTRIRERVLTPDEIRVFWTFTETLDPLERAIWRLRLLTGQRPQAEITQMEWAELDLDTQWWTIPASRTKNGRAHRVWLSQPAVEILRAIPRPEKTDGPRRRYVFRGWTQAHAVSNGTRVPLPDFQPRDLRRTMRTFMEADHIPARWAEEVQNHKQGGVAAHYNQHEYDREKQQALDHWARRLDAIIQNRDVATVLPFRSAV